jgi:hypothetical protein
MKRTPNGVSKRGNRTENPEEPERINNSPDTGGGVLHPLVHLDVSQHLNVAEKIYMVPLMPRAWIVMAERLVASGSQLGEVKQY